MFIKGGCTCIKAQKITLLKVNGTVKKSVIKVLFGALVIAITSILTGSRR
jgi:hypothetical protein